MTSNIRRWVPHNLTNTQEKVCLDWYKEIFKKYYRDATKVMKNIYIGDESSICSVGYPRAGKIQQNLFVKENTSKMVAIPSVLSDDNDVIACERDNSEWYTTISLPEVYGKN